MWTKKEDLQNKYVKLSSQQDYETVTKVLHEFGFVMSNYSSNNNKYYSTNPYLIVTFNRYYLSKEEFSSLIPIQQFYDYLSSKTLKVEDLVEGEIYYHKSSYEFIIRFTGIKDNFTTADYFINYPNESNPKFCKRYINPTSGEFRIATPKEKKWLNVCIKQDKFIPKTDLDLYDDITFELKSLQTIPEYVECIDSQSSGYILGKIYQTNKSGNVIPETTNNGKAKWNNKSSHQSKFKPSTKEAFESQNQPKFEDHKRNLSQLQYQHQRTVEKLQEQLEDAEEKVEAAYTDVSVEAIASNASQEAFAAKYWRGVETAESVVERINNQIDAAAKSFEEEEKVINEQIEECNARIAILSAKDSE